MKLFLQLRRHESIFSFLCFQAFDYKNDWNFKNREKSSRGRWQGGSPSSSSIDVQDFSHPPRENFNRSPYGWLCDLINQFGTKGGFDKICECFNREENGGEEEEDKEKSLNVPAMAALLGPIANCADMLIKDMIQPNLSNCMEKAFKVVESLDVSEMKSKEMSAISDLLSSIKLLCLQFWPQHVESCDKVRLEIVSKMLRTPQFHTKMNALKEVSRLIDECNRQRNRKNISSDRVTEWIVDTRVLSVALEGNIDQVQYTDRIKAIVEFLGPRLSREELTKMWQLQDSANAHTADNIHGMFAGAAAKFSLSQFELMTKLIKETWEKANDRVREKLLVLIGQIGKEANQMKSTQAILELLWEMAHLPNLPKVLVEKAMQEQLSILTEMTQNKDPMKKMYVLKCVADLKKVTPHVVPAVKHLHDICKSYLKGTSIYQKADKATLGELNKQHEIVKLLSMSLKNCHLTMRAAAMDKGAELNAATLFDERYSEQELVDFHLDLLKFLLKEGDLYLSWTRCEELWDTLVNTRVDKNDKSIHTDRDKIFEWFEVCLTDLETSTQLQFFEQKLLSLKPSEMSRSGFSCYKAYFESINIANGSLRKGISPAFVS